MKTRYREKKQEYLFSRWRQYGENQKLVAEAVIFSFSTVLPLDVLRRSLKRVISGKTVEVCSLFRSSHVQKVRVSMRGRRCFF